MCAVSSEFNNSIDCAVSSKHFVLPTRLCRSNLLSCVWWMLSGLITGSSMWGNGTHSLSCGCEQLCNTHPHAGLWWLGPSGRSLAEVAVGMSCSLERSWLGLHPKQPGGVPFLHPMQMCQALGLQGLGCKLHAFHIC